MTGNLRSQRKNIAPVLISDELERALDALYHEAQGYRCNDEFLLQLRGYCTGYVRAYRGRLSCEEIEMLRGYANVLLYERGGQPI